MSLLPSRNELKVRLMRREDVGLAVEWAAAEGWNPGLTDAASFWAADEGGFLIGELAGEPVSVISAVRYGSRYGFIGLYIVKPAVRGAGHGWTLWQAAMQRLEGRVVGLDGVVAQQDNYRRSGFELAHRNARFAGVRSPADKVPVASRGSLLTIDQVDFATLLAYDRAFFPEPREAFLRAWISQPGTVAFAAVDGSRLQGYGVLRPCREGFKIGPLFADSPALADALFCTLVDRVPSGQSYFFDIMTTQDEAAALVQRHGMRKVFETARMYLGPAPDIAASRTYGITSFELG